MGPNETSISCPILPPSKTAKLRNLYDAWDSFKEMLKLCLYHGLDKWLIVHTFYNGLSYTTKMTVDVATSGALMNKNYTTTYALIEDMTQNHCQWTNERVITASSPSKKEAGSAIEGVELMNYAQYNQGMRRNQIFYKTPQNSYGQMAPPGYSNNQKVPHKSGLEILMESYVMNQSKQLQEVKNQTGILNDSLAKLISKVDSISTHPKILETQISQATQQVAASSQTPEVFPG
ncbi:hypothetical protein MTR_6g465620 [Medicago truncatula]|uniref:Uncharacterized protein n=1 Tax=Medicago truncatula TaxID=3880 RepID=A0A072UC38_MEDTR|nr:hypothetical protein MTR_6g465620 [Medicago truncatula]